jgi:hypothetical protein
MKSKAPNTRALNPAIFLGDAICIFALLKLSAFSGQLSAKKEDYFLDSENRGKCPKGIVPPHHLPRGEMVIILIISTRYKLVGNNKPLINGGGT